LVSPVRPVAPQTPVLASLSQERAFETLVADFLTDMTHANRSVHTQRAYHACIREAYSSRKGGRQTCLHCRGATRGARYRRYRLTVPRISSRDGVPTCWARSGGAGRSDGMSLGRAWCGRAQQYEDRPYGRI